MVLGAKSPKSLPTKSPKAILHAVEGKKAFPKPMFWEIDCQFANNYDFGAILKENNH